MKTTTSCWVFLVTCCSVGYDDRQLREYDSDVNYDETKILHYSLPPLLVTAEGTMISTPEKWRRRSPIELHRAAPPGHGARTLAVPYTRCRYSQKSARVAC